MDKTPTEAFEWLFANFRDYMHNKLSWLDIRAVFAEAAVLSAQFKNEDEHGEQSDC